MKKTIAALVLTSTLCVAHAQDGWRQILSTDPWMSNGYFIVDHKKADQLQVETITVEIIADKLMANGVVRRTC